MSNGGNNNNSLRARSLNHYKYFSSRDPIDTYIYLYKQIDFVFGYRKGQTGCADYPPTLICHSLFKDKHQKEKKENSTQFICHSFV
jgi:hypothetical protein